MEFNQKLQSLRTQKNMTQEELAKELFVSRTAISKWERGIGYPNIDSLKAIAKYFHISIDELICAEEMLSLAEDEKEKSKKKYTSLICNILDCLAILLLMIPIFGCRDGNAVNSVSVWNLSGISTWLKILFISTIGITALNGFCGLIISHFDKPVWSKHRLVTGIALSVTGSGLFILARQPYAAIFCLMVLMIKGYFLIKDR